MNRPQPISAALVRSRWGRAALHVVCLIRRGPRRWHLRGIVRELFGSRRSHSGQTGQRLCAFLLCALSGGGFPVFAFAGSPALTLLPAARVDGSGIYLHQVASISLAVPISQTIRLANAPAFGQAAFLSREQIGELWQSLAPELASTNWSGAAQVRVVRRARPLAESELRDLLAVTLQKEGAHDRGELELRFMREFAIERRDVLSLREPLDESALKNPSLELVEAVPARPPLLARSVRMRPAALRGQMVDGLVRYGALHISLKAEALANGLPGQTVRVRNPKTKREFYAKVQDQQVVVINL